MKHSGASSANVLGWKQIRGIRIGLNLMSQSMTEVVFLTNTSSKTINKSMFFIHYYIKCKDGMFYDGV
ncbi:hypothetical protein D3C81_2201190 [compost metagenome]